MALVIFEVYLLIVIKHKMAASIDRPKTECSWALIRTLSSQLRVVNKGFAPYFTAVPDRTDMRIWYVRISGLDAPYKGGEYLCYIVAPDEFPHRPPSLKFLTDNGLFVPGHKVCISVGEFHANDKPGKDGAHGWRPSLGMHGFALEVVNALICHADLGSGIGIQHKSAAEKRYLASVSRKFNAQYYPDIISDFEEFVQANREILPIQKLLEARGEDTIVNKPVLDGVSLAAEPVQEVARPVQEVAKPVQEVAKPVQEVAEPVQDMANPQDPIFKDDELDDILREFA